MNGFKAAFLLVATASVLVAFPKAGQAEGRLSRAGEPPVDGKTISEMLRSGQPVVMEAMEVEGDIDLSGMDVAVPFVLKSSVVSGRLIGSFAIFRGTLDFTGSSFGGEESAPAVDLYGATFERDVRWPGATFGGHDQQETILAGARFQGAVDLRASHFVGPADFRSATFAGKALFQQALFKGPALFDNAAFQMGAVFVGTVFQATASFAECSVAENADFGGALFLQAASFHRISVGALLSLNDAVFSSGSVSLQDAFMGSLEMRDTRYESEVELHTEGLSANSLEIGMEGVERIHNDVEKCRILALVERSARANEKSAIANDASFWRQEIEDEMRPPGWQALNVVFRQWIAGYFVRPLHPLFAMTTFAALAWCIRMGNDLFRERRRHSKTRGQTLEQRLAVAAAALGASMSAIFSLKPGISVEGKDRQHLRAWVAAAGRWFEWAGQKALTATLLIALANTSSQAKDIIDSVFSF